MRKLAAAIVLGALVASASVAFALSRSSDPEGGASRGPARLDLRRTLGRSAPFLWHVDYRSLRPAILPDQIPAIDDPQFETPEEASSLLPPTSLVIGIEREGDARAYPSDLLSYHEIVNDVVGGLPVAITWCPICQTALGFERRVGDRVLTFGVSGYLYLSNLVLFDRETGSLWNQLLGGAITGRMRGESLRPVPVVHETWAEWLRQHPDTRVLSIRRDRLGRKFTDPSSYVTPRGVQESDDPYGTYVQKVGVYFSRRIRGVVEGAYVLGASLRGRAKVYPLSVLARRKAIEDVLAGEPILVTYHEDTAITGSLFSRRLRGRTLSFRLEQGAFVDRQTGSRWSLPTGEAVAGPLAGSSLTRLPATSSYWFAWRKIHPQTAVYRGGATRR